MRNLKTSYFIPVVGFGIAMADIEAKSTAGEELFLLLYHITWSVGIILGSIKFIWM